MAVYCVEPVQLARLAAGDVVLMGEVPRSVSRVVEVDLPRRGVGVASGLETYVQLFDEEGNTIARDTRTAVAHRVRTEQVVKEA